MLKKYNVLKQIIITVKESSHVITASKSISLITKPISALLYKSLENVNFENRSLILQ